MRRSWHGAGRQRCQPGAWSCTREGRRSQEPVGHCALGVWRKGVGSYPGVSADRWLGGCYPDSTLSLRKLQGLGGTPIQRVGSTREGCFIIPVRETEAPECLLTLFPLVHRHCCTLVARHLFQDDCNSPLSVNRSPALSPRPAHSQTLMLPASLVLHVSDRDYNPENKSKALQLRDS